MASSLRPPDGMVLVKIELEGMRHTVVHALTQHQAQMALSVDERVKAAIERFDIGPLVESEVRSAMSDAIRAAIGDAIRRLFWEDGGRQLISEAVEQTLLASLTKRRKERA